MNSPTTKNTLADLAFAEAYVDFVARRGHTPEIRARANIVQSTIILLDRTHPSWRAELLEALSEMPDATRIQDIFPIPAETDQTLLDNYIKLAMRKDREK